MIATSTTGTHRLLETRSLVFVFLVLSGAASFPGYALIAGWLFSFEVGAGILGGLGLLGALLGIVLASVFSEARS